MKKFFTLIACAALALSASAQEWNASNCDDLAKGTTLLDNQYVTITTGVQDSKCAAIQNADGTAISKKVGDYTFTKQTSIRVDAAPAADNNWEGTAYTECTPVGISLIVAPKANVDLTLYYGHGDNKAVSCYDVTEATAVTITETASGDGYTGVYKFQSGHNYVIYARGGTTSLWGIDTAAGTETTYEQYNIKADCTGTVELTNIKAEFLNNTSKGSTAGAGTWAFSAGKAAADQNGCEIKFTTKAAGRLTIYLQAKINAGKSINMFVDGNTGSTISCKLLSDDTVIASGSSSSAVIPAGSGVYYALDANHTYNFYFSGTKYAISGFKFELVTTAINTVNASAAKKAAKYVKNGQLVIETANGTFTAAGARVE